MDENRNTNFRIFLQQELIARCRNNANYSLRSYAKFLQIDASALSRILRSQRALSSTMIKRLGERCGLGPKVIKGFLDREALGSRRKVVESKFDDIEVEQFRVMADWYYWALIELLQIPTAPKDPKSLSKSLGITVSEVNSALERLNYLGIIVQSDGVYSVAKQNNSTVHYPSTKVALRNVQKQFLAKAISAIDDFEISERDHSTITVHLNQQDIDEAKNKIKAFRREMMSFFEANAERGSVYALTMSLFPLTVKQSKGTKNV